MSCLLGKVTCQTLKTVYIYQYTDGVVWVLYLGKLVGFFKGLRETGVGDLDE